MRRGARCYKHMDCRSQKWENIIKFMNLLLLHCQPSHCCCRKTYQGCLFVSHDTATATICCPVSDFAIILSIFFLYSSPLSSSTSHYGVKQQYQQQHYSTKARYRKTLITLHCIRLRARNFSRDKQQRRQIDGRTQRQSTAYKSNDFDSFFLFLYFIMKF